MDLVGTEIRELILIRLGTPWEHCSIFSRLSCSILLRSQAWDFSLAHAPQAIFLDMCGREEVLWMDDKVRADPAILLKVVVHLFEVSLPGTSLYGITCNE